MKIERMGFVVLVSLIVLMCLPHFVESQELEKRLEEVLLKSMQEQHVPGSVLVVVKDGRLTLLKGYGFANQEEKHHVSAESTLFRVGSISKIFTAAAVLKLAQQGKVDLTKDVSVYPGADKIKRRFSADITLHHLLTHTSGIDNTDIQDAAKHQDEIFPLGTLVTDHLPDQVFPPGTIFHYSNYGYALAGYIVETVTGLPFADAIETLVFQELEMKHSTFHQPPPGTLKVAVAVAYDYDEGQYERLPYDYSNVAPADVLVTTGEDISKFMNFVLNSENEMLRVRFSHHPGMPGVAYPFFVQQSGDQSLLTFTGGQLGFTSQIALLTEKRTGFFVTYNRRVSRVRLDVLNAFKEASGFTHPTSSIPLIPDQTAAPNFAGTYWFTDAPVSTIEKAYYLFGVWPEIKVNYSAGKLLVMDDKEDEAKAFRVSGDTSYLFSGNTAYQKRKWYENLMLHRVVIIVCSLLFLSGLLWLFPRFFPAGNPFARISGILLVLVLVALDVAFPILIDQSLDYGIPRSLKLVLLLPKVAMILTAVSLFFSLMLWKSTAGRFLFRVHFTTVALASALFMVILHYWNLLL